ncbi:SusC/RagA family TonB-linked outer membrane protein [Adhaeribacter aquaticus]|uniref:SusC/RagA family TonB-linked outer membrane protein n=1 Tax=Adhaeribacter aquaticus TaxID=299567 RepID=UPI0003FB031B|nr:TonB-dependent receptor [Adhaeribacter aquaticus]
MAFITGPLQLLAQAVSVSGTVKDGANGEALPGVTLLVKGTSNGTVTDVDGAFKLQVTNANAVLVVSYIGYTTQEVPVNNKTTLNIALQTDAKALEEVVVVGYGTVRKSDVTGAVATVDAQKITQVATVDVNQALQGKVSGVQITPSSGAPGTSAKVRIRGVGSFGNSDPLYVVDGFPTNNIDYISPTDIESMEVLKDASATAIYGNRGANGVILITTKKGKSGAPTFNFNTYAGIQNPWRRLDLANASQYATLYLEAFDNDNKTVSAADRAVLQNAITNNLRGTDWQREVMRQNAPIQNYNFSVNGGSDKSRYGVSATYFDQQGTIQNTGLKRFLLRINNDYTFNNRFTAGYNLSYANTRFNNFSVDQYSGVLPAALMASPVTPAWDPVTNNYGITTRFSTGNNPLRLANETRNQTTQQNRIVANVYSEVKLMEGLSFRSNFGGDLGFNKIRNYLPKFSIAPAEQRTLSSLYDERQQGYQWTWSNFFNYNKEIGDHSINAMAGAEIQNAYTDNINVTGFNIMNDPSQFYLGAAKQTSYQAGSTPGQNSLVSQFGRLNYSFKNKYLITATIRRDASSRFSKQNRVGIFPSFSLGWNVHEEDFFRNQNLFTTFKFRAGYGEVGNQNISNTATLNILQPQQRYSFNNEAVEGRAINRYGNPNLLWETAKMANVGFDAGFMNNRLNLTVEYFDKRTSDMIVTPPIPAYAGAQAPSINAGNMQNKGLETSLSFNKKDGAFTYDFGVNASFIRNKVLSLGGGQPIPGGDVNRIGFTTMTQEGDVLAYFYGRRTDGIFNSQAEIDAYSKDGQLIQPNAKPGDVKFVDLNNDGIINDLDRTKLGSALPDFTYGFNAFLGYKNFDLKLFIQGLQGNETVNALKVFTENPNGQFNSYASRMNRWTPENPNSNEPRMTQTDANQNITFSDRYVENGSYLRLRNLQIGYTLPQTLASRIKAKGLRVYVSADNLLTLTKYTGYEPEVGDRFNNPFYWGVDVATYPQARTFIGGLNINF